MNIVQRKKKASRQVNPVKYLTSLATWEGSESQIKERSHIKISFERSLVSNTNLLITMRRGSCSATTGERFYPETITEESGG